MSENAQIAPPLQSEPIFTEVEVARRMGLLAELLAALGVRCVLARNHRLVLRYNRGLWRSSGLTNPQLYVFGPDGTDIASTDGTAYTLAGSGREYPAADPAAAVTAIRHGQHAAQRT